jgi:hypothetical protein
MLRTDAVGTAGGKVTVSTMAPDALDTSAARPTRRRKRGYSTAVAVNWPTSKKYLLVGIPPALWKKAEQRARRKGLSMRALLLQLLTEWNQQP